MPSPRTTRHPVVACWGGADSAPAVGLAAALALALDVPLELTVAYEYTPVALSARPVPGAEAEERFETARTAAARARRLVPSTVDLRERVLPAERIAPSLCDAAQETDACLLVVGRDVDGHVARDVLRRGPCPVLVAGPGLSGIVPAPQRIAVAYDGSPAADHALVAARRLSAASGGTVTALCAGRVGDDLARPDGVDDIAAVDGDPGPALVAAAATFELLACGSRGHGRLATAILGSVSGALVAAAPCPVLVVGPRLSASDAAPLGLSTAARR